MLAREIQIKMYWRERNICCQVRKINNLRKKIEKSTITSNMDTEYYTGLPLMLSQERNNSTFTTSGQSNDTVVLNSDIS